MYSSLIVATLCAVMISAPKVVSASAQTSTILRLYLQQHLCNSLIDFANSCRDESLADGRFLFATCSDGHGGEVSSSVDLNRCVANIGGTLECQLKWVVYEKYLKPGWPFPSTAGTTSLPAVDAACKAAKSWVATVELELLWKTSVRLICRFYSRVY